ncbi:MAG: hypothetical protein RLZ32_910 [Gemmatimonadota bacterium]
MRRRAKAADGGKGDGGVVVAAGTGQIAPMSPGRPNPSDGAPPVPETTSGGKAPCNLPRRHLFVHLDGLVAVHAARAVHTALAGVPGVRTAAVTLAGAELEVEGTLDREALAAAVALAGATVREVVAQPRTLPLFEGDGA